MFGDMVDTPQEGGTLLPPGEGGGSRMRVRAERCASLLRFARTLTPTPLPRGEGLNVAAFPDAVIDTFIHIELVNIVIFAISLGPVGSMP